MRDLTPFQKWHHDSRFQELYYRLHEDRRGLAYFKRRMYIPGVLRMNTKLAQELRLLEKRP